MWPLGPGDGVSLGSAWGYLGVRVIIINYSDNPQARAKQDLESTFLFHSKLVRQS